MSVAIPNPVGSLVSGARGGGIGLASGPSSRTEPSPIAAEKCCKPAERALCAPCDDTEVAGPAEQEHVLSRVREICLALPCTSERTTNGDPTFFVEGTRAFATVTAGRHAGDRLSLWCAASEGRRDRLVRESPERFYEPAFIGYRDWLAVRLEDTADWDELGALLEEAYAQVAPPELAAEARARR